MGIEDTDISVQLDARQARKLVTYILNHGEVVFTQHARQEIAKDNRTEEDARNVLRAGQIYEPGELKNDYWRYRLHTQKFCAVVEFDSTTMMILVTFWEKKR
ncbi:DUF4258 domain-containing protein [Myxococcota bacterium]|nr:DUF4258 domain-containing protein [Myxococcota bacterium]